MHTIYWVRSRDKYRTEWQTIDWVGGIRDTETNTEHGDKCRTELHTIYWVSGNKDTETNTEQSGRLLTGLVALGTQRQIQNTATYYLLDEWQ